MPRLQTVEGSAGKIIMLCCHLAECFYVEFLSPVTSATTVRLFTKFALGFHEQALFPIVATACE